MFLYFTVRLTAADLALERAKPRSGRWTHRRLGSGLPAVATMASGWLQRRSLFLPRPGWPHRDSASNPALALMASQQAFSIARRAAETSEERQNAWYNLAGFYAAQNDAAGVEACLRRSVDASPNWFKSHWALAQVLLLSGRRTEALAEAERAADLDGGKDPEIAKFLQSRSRPCRLARGRIEAYEVTSPLMKHIIPSVGRLGWRGGLLRANPDCGRWRRPEWR